MRSQQNNKMTTEAITVFESGIRSSAIHTVASQRTDNRTFSGSSCVSNTPQSHTNHQASTANKISKQKKATKEWFSFCYFSLSFFFLRNDDFCCCRCAASSTMQTQRTRMFQSETKQRSNERMNENVKTENQPSDEWFQQKRTTRKIFIKNLREDNESKRIWQIIIHSVRSESSPSRFWLSKCRWSSGGWRTVLHQFWWLHSGFVWLGEKSKFSVLFVFEFGPRDIRLNGPTNSVIFWACS